MRRTLTSLIALLAAVPALADEIYTQAPVAAVTVFPDGAEMTHRASLDLPAGAHRVYLPYGTFDDLAALPRIRSSEGVSIGGIGLQHAVTVDREALFTPAQAEAWANVTAAEAQLAAQSDAAATARAEVSALQARLAYLAAARPGPEMNAEALLAMADTLHRETAASTAALVGAEAALRPLVEAQTEAEAALEAARAAFDRLSPPEATADMLAIDLSLASAGPFTLELTELTDTAGWMMDYDLDLDRAAGSLAVTRKLIVVQSTGRTWSDVALTLSTARPGERVSPQEVRPDLASLYEPYRAEDSYARAAAPEMEMGAAPMMEPSVMVGQTASMLPVTMIEGLALSYVYPQAVTIASDDGAELSLDTLALDATPEVHASPRNDDTAFTVATFTNTTAEPILPGSANVLRDGHLVGRTEIGLIPAGGEATLGFGPIEGLRLATVFARNEEGDTGILSKSNTRTQLITFTVENLTGEAQKVHAVFPLTYSEQEDLRVKVSATPAPDETDIDHKRGVSAWDLSLAPGETKEVAISVTLDWPEGQELSWYP